MTTAAEIPRTSGAAKILIPVGDHVSKELIARALHLLSVIKNPLIVLFHVIEIPSRTATLETEPYRVQIKQAEEKLRGVSKWLTDQGLDVQVKVAVARSAAEGIIVETEDDGYQIVFLMKRKAAKGWKRLFTRSVSERVVRSVNCLVMTAPMEHF
jgi:nucleotide-binding universal stress UspA family protein